MSRAKQRPRGVRWTLLLVGLSCLTVAGMVHLLVGARPPRLAVQNSGDERLGRHVRAALDGDLAGLDSLSVAVTDGDGVRFAGFGRTGPADSGAAAAVDANTSFEIGSVTKALTGMLLAELIESGAVRPDDTVAGLAGFAGEQGPGGAATVTRLASHRAGYPSLPLAPDLLLRLAAARLSDGDAYLGDRGWVLRQAGDVDAAPAPFD